MSTKLTCPMSSSPLANEANFNPAIGAILDLAIRHMEEYPQLFTQVNRLLEIGATLRKTVTRDYRAFVLDAIRNLLYHDYRSIFDEFGEFSKPSDDVKVVRMMLDANPNLNDPEAFKAMLLNEQILEVRNLFGEHSQFQNEVTRAVELKSIPIQPFTPKKVNRFPATD